MLHGICRVPDLAYREWLRVLKPGGVLYNFDADWYGHLYNEEKRSSYEKDRKQTEEQNVEDYYSGTDIEKMEEIARQVPLSRLERPKWDIETMQKAGFLDVSCDEEVWKEVWTEEEIINNSTSPIFLLTGRKRDAFHLKNVTVQPGQKWHGELELANGEIRLPATVLHGHGTGKTMLITAGVHAGEYVGIQAAIELAQKLKIEKVTGTVIIIKALNRPAFEARKGSMGLTDGKNLNREFPGNPDGTEWNVLHGLFLRNCSRWQIIISICTAETIMKNLLHMFIMQERQQRKLSAFRDRWQNRSMCLTW